MTREKKGRPSEMTMARRRPLRSRSNSSNNNSPTGAHLRAAAAAVAITIQRRYRQQLQQKAIEISTRQIRRATSASSGKRIMGSAFPRQKPVRRRLRSQILRIRKLKHVEDRQQRDYPPAKSAHRMLLLSVLGSRRRRLVVQARQVGRSDRPRARLPSIRTNQIWR
jgi:hypothetical protein